MFVSQAGVRLTPSRQSRSTISPKARRGTCSDIRELLRLLVEREGCAVVEATDGQEALDRAVAIGPDLILMDLAMPVMDGLEVCRRIRQDARTVSVPIVAVTAHHDKMQEAVNAGCNERVTKPVSSRLLRGVLQKYVDWYKP